jgi:HTH-type transcriptional regulator / antitoxin HigA
MTTERTSPTVPAGRLLRDDAEFNAAHAELLTLLDAEPEPGSAAHHRLEYLTVLIEAYDRQHGGIGTEEATPQDLVDFTLEQRGLTRADLHEIMGGKSRVSEFFSGRRALSITQVKRLREMLDIPADLLIPPDELFEHALASERRAQRALVQARALTTPVAAAKRGTTKAAPTKLGKGTGKGGARKARARRRSA